MIRYRLATTNDNQQLLELTSASGMTGEISLRIDRKPNFFKLLDMRGGSKTFVALNYDTIIGSLCVSLQYVYVGQQILPLYYIGDFKVAVSYRNKGVGLQLCNELTTYLLSVGADLAFLNVSKGNTKPLPFFKDRPNIPDFDNIGCFIINQFIGKQKESFGVKFKIEQTAVTDDFIKFLNQYYCQYQLGSVITKEKLEGTNIFTIRDNNGILGAMCLTDMMELKQNVVTGLSWKMKCLLQILNATTRLTGLSKMPVIGQPVQMIYIKYLAVKNNEKKLVKLLVNHARNIVFKKSYSFVSIGLHQNDPLNKCLFGLLKLTFKSTGMLISIKDNRSIIEKVRQGIPFEDYSLV